jgi:STE24 endopeptidase
VNEEKSTKYHRLRRRADLAGAALGGLVLLGLSVSGAALRLREAAAGGASLLPFGLEEPATVVFMTVATLVLLQLIEWPFAFYQGFVLEHRYGLSTQSVSHWLSDQVKGAALGLALGVVGASIVFAAIRNWPGGWWIASAAVFAVAMVGLVRVAPVLLLPIFYKFKPLDRPTLAARLLALAAKARTDVVGVFEWVVSSHTRKANAALAGMGRTRRILLSDTLLADFSEDEIEVILAHELAHHVHRDLWRGMVLHTVLLFAGFAFANAVLQAGVAPLGFRGLADPASLPLLMLAGGVSSFVMLPIVNGLSRLQERAADRYALTTTGNTEAFVTAMKRLSQQNLAEEYPSPVVRWMFHSHPPIRERIDFARQMAQMGQGRRPGPQLTQMTQTDQGRR